VDGRLRGSGRRRHRAEAKVVETKVTGEVGSDTITGNLTRAGYPAIPFHMTKRAGRPSEP
jgi:hypothetical protein